VREYSTGYQKQHSDSEATKSTEETKEEHPKIKPPKQRKMLSMLLFPHRRKQEAQDKALHEEFETLQLAKLIEPS
jgi:hypothetical protein